MMMTQKKINKPANLNQKRVFRLKLTMKNSFKNKIRDTYLFERLLTSFFPQISNIQNISSTQNVSFTNSIYCLFHFPIISIIFYNYEMITQYY